MAEFRELTTSDELSTAFGASSRLPVVLIKHSLTCGSSRSTLRDVEALAAKLDDGVALFAKVAVQTARDLSNEIERRTGITHETPQVFVLRDGKVVWHASHWRITKQAITAALAESAARGR
jgi:monothiol bacilliredoxin